MITNPVVNEYIRNEIVERDGILKDMEEYARINSVPIIQPEVAKLISVILKLKRPKKILEIGTAIGYSAIFFSKVLNDEVRIDTIERNPKMLDIAKINIEKAELGKNINIIFGDAIEVLKDINEEYDVIFIDGAKGQYLKFFEMCYTITKIDGVIISDNILYQGMVADESKVVRRKKTLVTRLKKYINNICSDKNLDTTIVPIGDGLGISYKIS